MKKRWRIGITNDMDYGVQHTSKGYLKGIESIDGVPVEIRIETPLDQLEALAETLDGVLFSGGADVEPVSYGMKREPECGVSHPQRDALEIKLLHICLRRGIPVLGICRGSQIINVALGGTLVQDIPKRFGKIHQMKKDAPSPFDHNVQVVPGTMLYEIMGGDIPVDSYHHQCVDRLAEGLIPSAYAPEGFVEAFELPEDQSFLMAVQWHPEVTLDDDDYSMRIFERFGKAISGQ